ncbi:MAG: hypothetical protein D6802_03295 [Ardenticatenia bacterium]|nr:MAG: hypothetical protein D6802_03295 [Ardenticatenia bacterium]
MNRYERLSVVVSLTLLGLAIATIYEAPGWVIAATILGSPVEILISANLMVGAVVALLVAAGTDYALREHPLYRRAPRSSAALFWILPMIVTLVSSGLLVRVRDETLLWLGVLLGTGLVLALVIYAELRTIDLDDPEGVRARLFLNVFTYFLAFTYFAQIYGLRVRTALAAPLVMIAAMIFSLTLLRIGTARDARVWLYSALIAFVMGELVWPMTYWRVSALVGGGVLTIGFYLLTGISQQYFLQRLSRQTLVEYATVVFISLVALSVRLFT